MKVALGQMEVVPNLPEKNVRRMLEMIEEAKAAGCDLIAFPEMCISGYLVGDRFLEDSFCRECMEYNEVMRKASRGIAVAYGNIYFEEDVRSRIGSEGFHPNKDGRKRKYNAAYIFQDGKGASRTRDYGLLPPGVQPKTLLPNYRFFDDERYFFSLKDIADDFGVPLESLTNPYSVKTKEGTVSVGFELCEDLWCNDYRLNLEALNPTKYLIKNGAEYIVNLSASPWTFGKNGARDRRIKFIHDEIGADFVPFYYVNNIGMQNNGKNLITFDGGSSVYNKDGDNVVLSPNPYKEDILIVSQNDLGGKALERREKPMIAQKYDAVIAGLSRMRNITGGDNHPRFIIGLSGGIDSSLSAALCVCAVGKGNVAGINMPTKYNSDKTKNAARFVAERLGIECLDIPVEDIVTINLEILEGAFLFSEEKGLSVLNEENVQAKIRGTSILSNMAAKYGALFTNNGNKLETALGYATLYGDVGGAVAPLGDLTKAEVFEMARYINSEIFRDEIIPEALIPDELYRFNEDQIEPSAELRDGQIDPMKFGYHDALLMKITDYKKTGPEEIMEWYLEGTMEENLGISSDLILRWGLDDPEEFISDLEWFCRAIQINIFKRVQSPPIIITSKSSYGFDIRESQLPWHESKECRRLKNEILDMENYKKI